MPKGAGGRGVRHWGKKLEVRQQRPWAEMAGRNGPLPPRSNQSENARLKGRRKQGLVKLGQRPPTPLEKTQAGVGKMQKEQRPRRPKSFKGGRKQGDSRRTAANDGKRARGCRRGGGGPSGSEKKAGAFEFARAKGSGHAAGWLCFSRWWGGANTEKPQAGPKWGTTCVIRTQGPEKCLGKRRAVQDNNAEGSAQQGREDQRHPTRSSQKTTEESNRSPAEAERDRGRVGETSFSNTRQKISSGRKQERKYKNRSQKDCGWTSQGWGTTAK